MLPIARFCNLSNRLKLHTRVNYIKHSPVYNLLGDAKEHYKNISGAIKVSENEYVVDKFGQYMRHSANPNCVVVGRCVIAIDDISPGDELTYDSYQKLQEIYIASK